MEEGTVRQLEFLKNPFVIGITIIRFLAALLILIQPMTGLVLSFIFDIVDGIIIIHILCFPRSLYHSWDKVVDWIAYITEFLVAISYGLYLPFFVLLFWRFAGQYMFMRHQKTIYFILFPNFFEMAFLWLIFFHPVISPVNLADPQPWGWLALILTGKLVHEIVHHLLWPKYVTPNIREGTVKFWRSVLPLHKIP